jgi:CheY-like chemotaxis protein
MRLAAQAKSIDLQFTILDVGNEEIINSHSLIKNPQKGIPAKARKPQFQVLGDPNRLQQIIWNLLSNAIKFTSNGGSVKVQLSIEEREIGTISEIIPQSPYAQITVSDTGIGINRDFLPYVFDSFRQADGSTTRKQGGLGLGLAIVRHLVELHGGTVTASSLGEGQGATFTVQLPLCEESKESIQAGRKDSSLSSGGKVESGTYSPLKGVRVLVVDDEADSRDFLVFALENYGAKATAASSASQALEVLESFKPHLLISDIGMPQADGYTLIHQVRTLPSIQGGNIPAIALTAYAGEKDRARVIAAGFQRHLAKPVIPDELANLIQELILESRI